MIMPLPYRSAIGRNYLKKCGLDIGGTDELSEFSQADKHACTWFY